MDAETWYHEEDDKVRKMQWKDASGDMPCQGWAVVVCIAALKRLRKRGMRIDGRHRFVVIDESKFAHKRKQRSSVSGKSRLFTFTLTSTANQRQSC
ncbi:hypothetical protein ABVT39_022217 [Epinephelus coioides]